MNAILAALLLEHPDARVVTDVGASMFSGWSNLKRVTYHENDNVIELEFE